MWTLLSFNSLFTLPITHKKLRSRIWLTWTQSTGELAVLGSPCLVGGTHRTSVFGAVIYFVGTGLSRKAVSAGNYFEEIKQNQIQQIALSLRLIYIT